MGRSAARDKRVNSRCFDAHPENHSGDSKGGGVEIHSEHFGESSTKMSGQIKQFDQSQQIGGEEPSGFGAQVRVKRKRVV